MPLLISWLFMAMCISYVQSDYDWNLLEEVNKNIQTYVPQIRYPHEVTYCTFYFLYMKSNENIRETFDSYEIHSRIGNFAMTGKKLVELVSYINYAWERFPQKTLMNWRVPHYSMQRKETSSCSILVTDYETSLADLGQFWRSIGKCDRRLHIHFHYSNRLA